MSTNGSIVFVADGVEKTLYNHSDSYPDYLGVQVLSWLRHVLEVELGEETARVEVAVLQPTPTDREPTKKELEALAEFHDPHVSSGKDWYAALRRTQGDLRATLRAGFYDASMGDFPLYSLNCEWAYVIDFDERVFEIYKGFQTSPPTEGRYVGRGEGEEVVPGRSYYPVQRVRRWSFDELPEQAEVEKLEGQLS
jgi:hypothetical protein